MHAESSNAINMIAKTFDEYLIRAYMINDIPYFVGKDVAVALGYADYTNAIRTKCVSTIRVSDVLDTLRDVDGRLAAQPEKINLINELGSLRPQTGLIPESDVYRLITQSTLPSAKRFQQWLYEEVLPALRKYGRYDLTETKPTNIDFISDYLLTLNRTISEQLVSLKAEFSSVSEELASVKSELNSFRTGINSLLSYRYLEDKLYSASDLLDLLNEKYFNDQLTLNGLKKYLVHIKMIKNNGEPFREAVEYSLIISHLNPLAKNPVRHHAFTVNGVAHIIEKMMFEKIIKM